MGVTLATQGSVYLSDWPNANLAMWAVGLLTVSSSALILIGYMTPLASVVGGLVCIGTWFPWFPTPTPNLFVTRVATVMAAAIAVAIVCLGPGAFSLDARLFGRREIIIPKSSSSSKP
jgi:uncharacterized membrane protein YphA (DoxX/SURF4 family)